MTQSQHTEILFLYTNNEFTKENRKTIPFTIASRKFKYLEINVIKKVKDSTIKTAAQYKRRSRRLSSNGKILLYLS